MGSLERLHLRWNDFESNIKLGFSELRQDEDFYDVTLACESKQVKAHKVILSACSPFFRSLIKSVSHAHPLLYLRGIKFAHLEALLSFMYNGEVNVTQEELTEFLSIAEELKIRGLTQEGSSSSSSGTVVPKEETPTPPPNKRPRLNHKPPSLKAGPSSISARNNVEPITIDEDDDEDDLLSAGPLKREEEVSHHPPGGGRESQQQHPASTTAVYDNELHEEKYIPGTDFLSGGTEDVDFNSEDHSGYGEAHTSTPGGSSLAMNENEEMNEKLNAEINKLIKRTPDGLYQCIPCKKTTKRLQNLQFHVESLHVITDGFECKFCGTVLKTRQSHQKHVKKHERTPAYVQTR
uniref:Broad-complex core protein isoform 6 n=2 Tax=Caligus rogercresseyi TaxID=217165 RepID=C1BPC5_CALRO|nr:Broad-complex core protein isoform 6 [Caligus rogercresseyi]